LSRLVVIFAFGGALALDVTGPAEVFAMANRFGVPEGEEYDLKIVSLEGGCISTASGVRLVTEKAETIHALDTLIVSGGLGVQAVASDPRTSDWIRQVAKRARRTCSVCTGAFILAEAGLLNGRRASTHWASGKEFRDRYPLVDFDVKPIYVRDGAIWTSAGVAAGIDLALALTEDDFGQSMAINIAKQLVVFLHRPGGQAQFSSTLAAQSKVADRELSNRFRRLHAWMAENLAGDLSVPALADYVNMAPRSFARLYAAAMGATPAKAVEDLRLEAAKRSLEKPAWSLKEIAAQCGFGSEERLRRSFVRRYRVAPSIYRERFGPPAPSP
jgi:transcriptional regulator GlxA family with amidase domain